MTGFLFFAQLCSRVEGASGSLQKIDLIAAFLAELEESELQIASNLVMGTVFPPGSDLVMGVGPSILYEALGRACGCPPEAISDMLRATGDPGLVAEQLAQSRRPIGFGSFIEPEQLSIAGVYQRFLDVARAAGKRSQDIKVKNLQYLFSQATPLEAKYVARLAIEDLRIGVGEGGVRDALAKAFTTPAEEVERGYNLTNDMGLVAVSAKRRTLADLSIAINHPIKMMLAQLGESIPAAMQEMGQTAVEWKFDGARVQIHKDGDKVRIYSRRLENVTGSLPEIVSAVTKEISAPSAILDGEAVALGPDGRPRPFQEILKRFRRKYNVKRLAAQIPLTLFVFDLIYLNGKSAIDLPLLERRRLLADICSPKLLADQTVSDRPERVEEIYQKALNAGHEGIMLKNPSSVYAPGKRGKNWLKIKPVMETLDLVVIGAKWGEGRRATFLGSYRLACRDPETGNLLDVGWVATGFSDEALADLTEMFKDLVVVDKAMEVELKPAVIFEVAYEEIQRSPNYSSGYALRFPRLVAVRSDKSLEEADALDRIISLYKMQRGRNSA